MRPMASNAVTGVYWKTRPDILAMMDRMAGYFEIDRNDIVVTEGTRTALLHVPQPQQPYAHDWSYSDDRSHTASAYPIRVDALLGAEPEIGTPGVRGAKALSDFYDQRHLQDLAFYRAAPPLCLMHHDIGGDTITAFNDAMGSGRLYVAEDKDVVVLSSDALVAGLMLSKPAELNPEYWDSFFVWGHGQGAEASLQSVKRVSSGAKVRLGSTGEVAISRPYSETKLLGLAAQGEIQPSAEFADTKEQIRIAAKHSSKRLSLGLSGGQDSRFVAAAALAAGVEFKTLTRFPPDIEVEVAEMLIGAVPADRRPDWEAKPYSFVRQSPTRSFEERAISWFQYRGGDSWSTNMRVDPIGDPQSRTANTRGLSLSGAFGEITRGHNYFPDEKETGDRAVERFVTYMGRIRADISLDLRQRGIGHTERLIEDGRSAGLDGKHLLDYLFYAGRMRSGYPVVDVKAFLPMFTLDIFLASFTAAPDDKLANKVIREGTARLAPFWADIPYERELGKDRPKAEVNKVAVQPTHWEIDRDQFFATVERALIDLPELEVGLSDVERMIDEQKEGRARTNQTVEFMLWHRGARLVIEQLAKLQIAHAYNG